MTKSRMPAPERVRVLIADDHPLMRSALTQAIGARAGLEVVGEAQDGAEALARLRELRPDVALLDVRMGELSGIDVLEAIKREGIETSVLFLSTYTDSAIVYEALALGAAGYLDKVAFPDEICDAIVAVARGDTVLSPTVERSVAEQIRGRRHAGAGKLSPRELEILRLITAGLTGPQIASRLHVALSTVKTHVQHIYEKLGAHDRASAVAEAMRQRLVE